MTKNTFQDINAQARLVEDRIKSVAVCTCLSQCHERRHCEGILIQACCIETQTW